MTMLPHMISIQLTLTLFNLNHIINIAICSRRIDFYAVQTEKLAYFYNMKKIFLWCTTYYTDVSANFLMKLTVLLLSAAEKKKFLLLASMARLI
ncbi:hypothetical protein T06_6418 [Trichinella sp. T6]|nr:hypothetical protein T06_6418 [Trichinella sp. T6]